MEQLKINGTPVWIGHESGGFGNFHGYKVAVAEEKPQDEILSFPSAPCETAYCREWQPATVGFFDTPGRRQILFQAAMTAGCSTENFGEELANAALRAMDEEERKRYRRRLEDRLRKDFGALLDLAQKCAWARSLI